MASQIAMELKLRYLSVIKEKIIDNFKDIDVILPPLHGDNFTSACDYVTIHFNEGPPLQLFVKRMVNNPGHSELVKGLKLFDKEAEFFNLLLPAMKSFVLSKLKADAQYKLNMMPRCLYADPELVMMENVTFKGYALLNKVERQDLNHAVIVMKSLAKFHAPSYLMIKEAGVNEFCSKYSCLQDALLIDGAQNGFGGWMNTALEIALKIMKVGTTKECEYAQKVVEGWKPNLVPEIQKYFTHEHGHVCYVVDHGDCWNNNMMFLLDDQKNVLDHILVDFQIIRAGSPNLDISYYLFTSLKHQVRREEFLNLLKIYYQSFTDNVNDLGGQVDFTFEELLKDYKGKFVAGFIFGVCMSGSFEAYGELGNLENVEGDVMEYINTTIERWVNQNPQKTLNLSRQLSAMFQEYKDLIDL